ncbi:MAG: DNA mismatch repair endonuclease MutL [Devosiaceae bacterium]|nr:DNA mismatch repair endonuclease MutL [Devosiaceae bacterium]
MAALKNIKKLPENLINRIAAGEVVERPASVIKELVENSIDAGATHVSIITAKGGKDLMRVSDNGSGMDEGNLKLCVERHATSKLSGDQLDRISSLGFRGEALASIGSVAQLSVKSRPHNQDAGLMIEVTGGKISQPGPVSMNKGTIVEVKNLFAKVPARLKFLKGDRAENSAITDIIKRLAMANPSVHFILEGGDRQTSNWPGQTGPDAQKSRLGQIIGSEFINNSVILANERHKIVVTGMAGLPTFTRANSMMQFFFVNGRAVRDKVLIGAIRAAYGDFIFRGRFPVVAIFVDIDPGEVDVNVHPAKTELRFRDAGAVRSAVIAATGLALNEAGYRASSQLSKSTFSSFKSSPNQNQNRSEFSDYSNSAQFTRGPQTSDLEIDGLREPSARYEEPPQENYSDFALGAARAQIFENYIIAQSKNAMIMIDQHAAHERLVYEKFKAELARGNVASQIQLIPQIIELNEDECAALEEISDDLDRLGLGVEKFGPRAIAVRNVPALLGDSDVGALIHDLVDGIKELAGTSALNERMEAIIGTMACHGSVRSGRVLSVLEMNALLREMETTNHSGQCIHGRPTYVELKLNDIERLFGRG